MRAPRQSAGSGLLEALNSLRGWASIREGTTIAYKQRCYNDDSLVILDQVSGSNPPLTSTIANLPAGSYKVKIANKASSPVNLSLTLTHC